MKLSEIKTALHIENVTFLLPNGTYVPNITGLIFTQNFIDWEEK
jgi:hypothetical protein